MFEGSTFVVKFVMLPIDPGAIRSPYDGLYLSGKLSKINKFVTLLAIQS